MAVLYLVLGLDQIVVIKLALATGEHEVDWDLGDSRQLLLQLWQAGPAAGQREAPQQPLQTPHPLRVFHSPLNNGAQFCMMLTIRNVSISRLRQAK